MHSANKEQLSKKHPLTSAMWFRFSDRDSRAGKLLAELCEPNMYVRGNTKINPTVRSRFSAEYSMKFTGVHTCVLKDLRQLVVIKNEGL